jgi:hypothetical protein
MIFRFCLLLILIAAPSTAREPISVREYMAHVKRLSAPEMKGRGTGTPQLDKAAEYIAAQLSKAGVKPAGAGGYFQTFPVSVDGVLGPGNGLSYTVGAERRELRMPEDFIPLSFSGAGMVEGELVFAGYGITAREYGYDDYDGVDARGRIAVVLAHEPQEYDSGSRFEGRVYTEHSQLFSKAMNARAHGASGVVYVCDTANHSAEEKLEKFVSSVSPADAGMPFVHVRSEIVEGWFTAAGRDFKQVQSDIDKHLRPDGFAFPASVRVSMNIDVSRRTREVRNVVGYLPGRTDEYVIVGAHYDHLGLGEQYSMSPDKAGTPHPGADDNASGVAGLLSLARWFGKQAVPPRRGILFLAFAGEEIGLLGSSYYVNRPAMPLERASVMINMDMIGRIGDGKVMVGGAESAPELRPTLEALQQKHRVKLDLEEGAVYGSSDHTSFKTKLVPVLFFFSGLHADYHRPSDTWEKIDARGAVRLLGLVQELIGGGVGRPGTQRSRATTGSSF